MSSKKLFFRRYLPVTITVFLVYFLAIGIANNRISLFLLPVCDELAVPRTSYSLTSSLIFLSAFVSNLFFGVTYRRFGYRVLAGVTLLLAGTGYFLMSRADRIWVFYLAAILFGLGDSYYSSTGTGRMITAWYTKNRGLVLGVVLASSGLGGALMSIVLNGVITGTGWRPAYVVCALLTGLLAVPVFLFGRTKPEEIGLKPWGADEAPKARGTRRPAADWEGLSMSKLTKTVFFYLALLAVFLFGCTSYGSFPYFVTHLQDRGMTSAFAAAAQSTMFITMALGKILEGLLCDRLSLKTVLIICIATTGIGLVLVACANSPFAAIAGMTIYSIGLGAPSVLLPILSMQLFGRRDYDVVLGLMFGMHSLSGVVAGPLSNLVYDRVGSYTGIFLGFIGVAALVLLLYLVAFRLSRRERAALEKS